MSHSVLSRGVGAGALTLALCFSASAQEALPTIDISAQAPSAAPATTNKAREKAESAAYARTTATAATKANSPILDTPRAVAVVPKQVLEDNQVLNTQDAVRFVSGVQQGLGVYYDAYIIRGVSSGSNTYRNGLKLFSVVGSEDVSFVDRVEIVKGPAAMLYGRIQPGGLVNFVTKRPQDEAEYSIQEQFGSWGLSRTSIDLTGPVTADKSVLYRVMGSFDRADSWVNFEHHDKGAFSGEVSWRPSTQFEANVGLEYYNDSDANRGGYAGMIPVIGTTYKVPWLTGRPAYLPRNWTQNDPQKYSQLPDVIERETVSADWTYRFNDQWKITNRFMYNHSDESQNYLLAAPTALNYQTANLLRRVSWSRVYRDTWSINLDVAGEVKTGPLKHNLLFGFDYFDYHHLYLGDNPAPKAVPEIPAFNIWAPSYGGVNWSIIEAQQAFASGNKSRNKSLDVGYYVQDDISYDDFIHFLIGGRYDVAFDANSELAFATVGGSPCYPLCDGHYNPPWKGNPTYRKISPNGGLLFKLTPEYSIYASYSESFGNSNATARSASGAPFKPQEGQQFEVGAKASILDGKVTASIAAFDLYLTNVLTADPVNSGYSIAAGKVRSRGVELDVAGQVTDNISLIASYTYDDAMVVKDNTTGTGAILGKRQPGVPRHAGNFWAKYDTAPGQKEGWSFGFGAFANGLREATATNAFALPGYVRFDTMIGYRTLVLGQAVEAQLNVINLADAKYFDTTVNSQYAVYGQPRTFIGSIKVKF
ncbi:MAG TPA: TonB-dependent siderophore receptor [Methylosinus sp.]|jgi:iron complex outermembrane receptor protein|uniref:TonB-dependent siderophore receptor n=1 Tax=Methylosinus sp. TaxID=427 RepID=UPI002F958F47